jgi:hypothetical protein
MKLRLHHAYIAAACTAALLAACGGGGSNPLDNPPSVANPAAAGGQRLSFLYFKRCVQPLLDAELRVNIAGSISTNTCASGGCHDNRTGTGGALRLVGDPAAVPAGAAPDALRDTDLYRNFYSAQGETIVGQPTGSRLLNKPLLRGVLHGGGLIFESEDDDNARLLRYWISRPMPQGQDEFSTAAASMFTPPDPETGTCNLQ